MIFTQGLSLNQLTPIVRVFLHNQTCASKIFARKCEILNIFMIISGSHLGLSLKYHITALKYKIRYQNCDCDVKFKKTMFDNTFLDKNHGFYGGHFEIDHNDQLHEKSSIGNLIQT